MIRRWLVNLLAGTISKEVERQLDNIQKAELDAELDSAVGVAVTLNHLSETLELESKVTLKLTEAITVLVKDHKHFAICMLDLNKRLTALQEDMEEEKETTLH